MHRTGQPRASFLNRLVAHYRGIEDWTNRYSRAIKIFIASCLVANFVVAPVVGWSSLAAISNGILTVTSFAVFYYFLLAMLDRLLRRDMNRGLPADLNVHD